MFIARLQTTFRLHGCSSLKDKRHRLSGLRDKFGSIKNIAVCENGANDALQFGNWSFVCTCNDKALIESSFSKILEHCAHNIDAELVEHSIEWL